MSEPCKLKLGASRVFARRLFGALLFAVPFTAFADHDCLENLRQGPTVKRERAMPRLWFQVDGKTVVGPALHKALKKRYPGRYISGFDEGEFGYLCVKTVEGYAAVSQSDFGNGVSYSAEAPKCLKCGPSGEPVKRFTSGSGLKLGQSRAQVAAIVGTALSTDVVNLEFTELLPGPVKKTWHTEILRIEFADDVLVRFSVFDYREAE